MRRALALAAVMAVAAAIGFAVTRAPGQPPAPPAPISSIKRTPITPSPVPAEPRTGDGFTVVEDASSHQLVLFGGVGDYDNTWIWDGESWNLAHPMTSPGGRFGASAAYDPETRTVMLFGGRAEDGTLIHDTWAWNGSTWLDLDSGAGGPPPGEGSDMAWDPALRQMLLVTGSGVIATPGDTWVWAGTHWNHPSGGTLAAGALFTPMQFDPVTESMVAVGCCQGPPPRGVIDTTWRWDGSRWQMVATHTAAPIDGSTMALDPVLDRVVLCTCTASTAAEPELTEWDGHDWVTLHAGRLPVQGGIEVTDPDQSRLLLIGAAESAPASNAMPLEVWSLTGATWTRLDGAGSS